MRLAAGLRPDPLGSYSAPPDSLAVVRGTEGREGEERVGNRGRKGEKEGGKGVGKDWKVREAWEGE